MAAPKQSLPIHSPSPSHHGFFFQHPSLPPKLNSTPQFTSPNQRKKRNKSAERKRRDRAQPHHLPRPHQSGATKLLQALKGTGPAE
jgi:hypothetical protein